MKKKIHKAIKKPPYKVSVYPYNRKKQLYINGPGWALVPQFFVDETVLSLITDAMNLAYAEGQKSVKNKGVKANGISIQNNRS